MAPTVGREEIRAGIRELGLSGRPVCAHSSLRSFGTVDGGAQTVVEAFVDEGCTLLVPTFAAKVFAIAPPEEMRPEPNGLDYKTALASPGAARVFTTASNDVSPSMGAIPAAVLARGSARATAPCC